jgi:hypothetical protein
LIALSFCWWVVASRTLSTYSVPDRPVTLTLEMS